MNEATPPRYVYSYREVNRRTGLRLALFAFPLASGIAAAEPVFFGLGSLGGLNWLLIFICTNAVALFVVLSSIFLNWNELIIEKERLVLRAIGKEYIVSIDQVKSLKIDQVYGSTPVKRYFNPGGVFTRLLEVQLRGGGKVDVPYFDPETENALKTLFGDHWPTNR